MLPKQTGSKSNAVIISSMPGILFVASEHAVRIELRALAAATPRAWREARQSFPPAHAEPPSGFNRSP
jgi:hypothetical protein